MLRSVGTRWMLYGAALCASSCGSPGVVEVHRFESAGSMGAAAGAQATSAVDAACPSGWNCMDLSAIGEATDSKGAAVSASCSTGGIMPCNEDDPAASCTGLPNPVCVHLNVGGQKIVGCGQRCSPE